LLSLAEGVQSLHDDGTYKLISEGKQFNAKLEAITTKNHTTVLFNKSSLLRDKIS